MMLFKFDIKYVKLNFKAMASMDFSFSLKLNLLCSYDGSLFMKTVENCFKKILENSSFTCFNWLKITVNRSSETGPSIWFDWLSIVSRSIECSFSIDRVAIEYQLSQADCLVWIFSFFQPIKKYNQLIEICEFWIFLSVFT